MEKDYFKNCFENIPFAYVKINQEGNILEYNSKFEDEFISSQKESEINQISEEINFEKPEQRIIINKILYSVFMNKDEKNREYNLFFNKVNLPDEYKTAVGLIFIDNYDEVLDTLEEFKHPLLLAIVDRKIKKAAKDLGGVVRKFEKDKYIFFVTTDKLNDLKESKFDILDGIREIDMGNKIPVTLSIGIGINGSNLDENMEFARVSIDLALSRGGDQVIIKDGETYQFFGGHSKEIGKNSRVRARVKAYALTDLIDEASNVIIMGHKNIDLDCLGAGIGVYSIVSGLEKNCHIVLNNVTSSVSGLYEKLIKDEKYENAFISGEEALKLVNRKTLLIIVDTYKASMCECPELIEKCKKVVVFDHHRKGVEYIDKAVLTYHEPSCSSTCELITEMLMYINKNINIKSVEADSIPVILLLFLKSISIFSIEVSKTSDIGENSSTPSSLETDSIIFPALSQLSRAVEQRKPPKPMLSDLRESGAIEQDADVVCFLYREEYYNPETEKRGQAEIIIAKQRNGSVGSINLAWLSQYTKFANLERTYIDF